MIKRFKLKVSINWEIGLEYFTTHKAALNYFNRMYKNYEWARFIWITEMENEEEIIEIPITKDDLLSWLM